MPVGAGAGAARCRPVPTGAGAAERPQETLYFKIEKSIFIPVIFTVKLSGVLDLNLENCLLELLKHLKIKIYF